MKTFKSIWAVFAGFLVVVVLSTATDAIIESFGAFSMMTTGNLVIALAYRSIYTILGGYVTAWLAPVNPMRHVVILGIIGTVAGIAGVIVGWDLSAHWYPIAIAATGFILTYIGGKIRTA